MYICMYMYIYIYIYIHTHTHICSMRTLRSAETRRLSPNLSARLPASFST